MPKNKDALIRYRVINRCLRERTYVTLQDLKEACERTLDIYPIGERTIQADINAMRYDGGLGYNAPIKIDRGRGAYYYEDPNFSIDNIPLNEDEIESLVFASRLLEQYSDIEIFRTFTGSVRKLVDTLNVYRLNDEDTIRNFIEFETAVIAKGTEFLEPLIEALKNRHVVRIEYKSFTSRKKTVNLIHPYHLKEYRNRWYLIGYNDTYSGIRTYCLDRILSVSAEENVRFTDKGFDARKYYENVIGVSVINRKPVEILIEFSEVQAQYVITQPLHHSQQRVTEIKDRIVFRYFLVPNFELIAAILYWGEEVKVLKPKQLTDKILQITRKTIDGYTKT
jgi:predicted DNA-binding transcriptional regulator YafY